MLKLRPTAEFPIGFAISASFGEIQVDFAEIPPADAADNADGRQRPLLLAGVLLYNRLHLHLSLVTNINAHPRLERCVVGRISGGFLPPSVDPVTVPNACDGLSSNQNALSRSTSRGTVRVHVLVLALSPVFLISHCY
jgi:hypothetical protein